LLLELMLAVLCGVFSAARSAAEEISESKVKAEAENGRRWAVRLLKIMERSEYFSRAMQTWTVTLTLTMLVLAQRQFAPLLDELMPVTAASLVISVAGALLLLVLCFFTPDALGRYRPERVCRAVLWLAEPLALLLRPLIWLLSAVSGLLLRLFGINPKLEKEQVSEDEIRLMVDMGEESGAIESAEKEMIENVFEFNNMTAEDVMVHRTDMVVIWQEDTPEQIMETIRENGLSRFPVCGEDIDDVLGILNARDYLLSASPDGAPELKKLLRSAYFVPEAVRTDVLFRDMQKQKVHMAIVVDEYGGTSGLLTMEDLLEELVGEIYDEFDDPEEQDIVKMGDNLWRISGGAPMESVCEELGVELPEEEEYDTLGGLVFSRLSVIPEEGSRPQVDALGLHIEVQEIAERRVVRALVSKLPPEDEAEAEEE
jgi:putative hemolysin